MPCHRQKRFRGPPPPDVSLPTRDAEIDVPPERNRLPPSLTVAPKSVPPLRSTSRPLLLIWVPLAMPPDDTFIVPPLLMAAPISVPPAIISTPPAVDSRATGEAAGLRNLIAAPGNRRAERCSAGCHLKGEAATDDIAAQRVTGRNF
jgi:hypothetical protein